MVEAIKDALSTAAYFLGTLVLGSGITILLIGKEVARANRRDGHPTTDAWLGGLIFVSLATISAFLFWGGWSI